jgi:hypothetical protein
MRLMLSRDPIAYWWSRHTKTQRDISRYILIEIDLAEQGLCHLLLVTTAMLL